jgi:UPF0042 nucleotide-binding protein
MRIILVTGMSGSGKSIVLNVLEDAGFAVIDNLPARFVNDVVAELHEKGHTSIGVSIDARGGVASLSELPQLLRGLRQRGWAVQVLFLTADTQNLVQRYSETRRRHPLSSADEKRTLEEAIEEERRLLAVLDGVGQSIDTSDLPANTLRSWVRDFVGGDATRLTLLFESFAFKDGVPLDADLVFDVRCLPNPFYEPALRDLSGRDAAVRQFLEASPEVNAMVKDIGDFVERWLPSYIRDQRNYLTIALGCTGGQHRSVYCAETLAQRFIDSGSVLVRHRSLDSRRILPPT